MSRIVCLLAVVYAVAVLFVFPKWTVDDAYITYRYADNLAAHGQLTWNVDEDPIEGYTGVALPVVLAGAERAGVPVDVASKTVGVSAFLAGALLLFLLLRRLGVREAVCAAVVALYLGAPFMFAHALSGLETTLFGTLVIASLCALLVCLDRPARRGARETVLFVLLLLTCLTRPEGAALAAIAAAALGLDTLLTRRGDLWPFVARLAVALVLPGLAYFLWRYQYYGQLLPNTYYAKVHHSFTPKSLASMGAFLAVYMTVPALACLLAGLLSWGRFGEEARERRLRPGLRAALWTGGVGLGFLLLVWFEYTRSALRMNFSYRFFAPFFPILLAFVGVLLDLGVGALLKARETAPLRLRAAALLLGVLAIGQGMVYRRMLSEEISAASSTKQLLSDEHIPAGLFLKSAVPPSEWLAAVVDAGAIPYYSGLKTIDFGGLNDEYLSKRRRDKIPKQALADYLYEHNPGAIVVTSKKGDRAVTKPGRPIVEDPRFAGYVLVKSFGSAGWPSYFELVFLRRDLVDGLAETRAER